MEKSEKVRILKKLEEMNKYLSELQDILPDEDEYNSNLIKRRACEKTVELAIESLIDICFIINSSNNLGLAEDEEQIFSILAKNNVINEKLSKKLQQMKGFRNIIVHRYGEVNDSLTYDFLTSNLGDFEEFDNSIRKYLSTPEKAL